MQAEAATLQTQSIARNYTHAGLARRLDIPPDSRKVTLAAPLLLPAQ